MPRPQENRTEFKIRLKPEDKTRLKSLIISLGYTYKRGTTVEPAWVEFFEAIARDEILLYKKISQGVDKSE